MSKPVTPAGLSHAGSKLWRDVVAAYDLRVDELAVLESAARAQDRIAEMNEILAEQPVMTRGSMGQPVVHPLIAEVRAHEAQVAQLLARLKLPDDGASGEEQPRSVQARAAAQSRWAIAHGKGA